MTALSQPTAIDGYRWLKNDIIRGTYQPDEKLRMSLLTARYALGVGPLREALSQLVAERLVTVVNQKGYRVASMSEAELLDIFDGCGSHYLLQMRERLFDLAARYRFIWLRETVLSVEMLEDKHIQHHTLTEAILAREAARASELMRQHLLTPIPIIRQAMAGKM
ncbi:GntR family transcriptional regulator [Salmonella enterica]|nr:GntR family transcriptional regulator [Salmonella enterica]